MPLCAGPFITRATAWKEEGAAEYAGREVFCFVAWGDVLFRVT